MFVTLGPSNLRDQFLVKVEETQESITVDLFQEPAAFPQPSSFEWFKDGLPLTGFDQLTSSNVTFDAIKRTDAGNYTVLARNFALGAGSMEQVGNDTGSFYLDVLCKFNART
jgi:hypothetical protein